MPLVPKALGKVFDRFKQRVKEELGFETQPPVSAPTRQPNTPNAPQRIIDRGPPRSSGETLLRFQRANGQTPRCLVHALYQAEDADTPTWRHLAAYSTRPGKKGLLIYAACEADSHLGVWPIESFYVHKFHDVRVTDLPWPGAALHPFPVEL